MDFSEEKHKSKVTLLRAIFLRKFMRYIDKLIGSGKQGNAIQFGLGCVSLGDSSEFGMRIGQKAVRAK